jgi:hypothetical protein
LVVTDLQKYLEKPPIPLTATGEALANTVNEFSKRISYDFNRVRRSVIDAYEGIFLLLSHIQTIGDARDMTRK